MQNFFVYILKCHDNSYYAGHTDNLELRIAQHNAGRSSGYTATRLPIEVVFIAKFESRDQAITMERKIKGWNRKKKEALIQGDYNALKLYAQNRQKN